PRFVEAVLADAKITLAYRAEPVKFRSSWHGLAHAVRLAWVSDAFLAQVCYRAKARAQARGLPIVPQLAHRLAMMTAQVCIGDRVVMEPGVYIARGQVVIDGISEVKRGAVFFPWVTIGLRAGDFNGPTIEEDVKVGTGAKVFGPITLGRGASIGANAVVFDDV